MLQQAINELHAYLERKVDEVREFQRSLATLPGEFNHRQMAILQHALRHPDASYTVTSHSRSHAVVRQTARQDLIDLEEKELLVRVTEGRKFLWIPANDLFDRLQKRRVQP